MINVLFLVLCLVTTSTRPRVHGMQNSHEEDLELERQLRLINKPPVKSIHTKFGYIVDCIDINKQPAFDHPLLKNHKLQRKPSFQKIEKASMENSPTKPIFGLEKNQCPIGTVPIRRTTKDDLVRAKSFLNDHILTPASPGSHVAQVTLETNPDSPYYGVRGLNSVYNPRVQKDQSSASIMWVRNGPIEGTNKIAIGWHVAPALYNDDATHFYAVWTSDNFKKTGCYNFQCPGYVQIDQHHGPSSRINNISTYGGPTVDFEISILQDPETKNWWLNVGQKNFGYFPAALFSNMSTADQIGWGGRTTTSLGTPSPSMGSGYFPDGNFDHACYFSNIAYQNESRMDDGPDVMFIKMFTDKRDCFRVKYYADQIQGAGFSLQFGGPGGNCDN